MLRKAGAKQARADAEQDLARAKELLALKEGDDVEVRIADDRTFLIARDERKPQALALIRSLRKPLPAGWRAGRTGSGWVPPRAFRMVAT